MSRARLRFALSALLALLGPLGLRAVGASATPVDTATAAFTAEDSAPIERVRLFVDRAGVADVYYIDRIRPHRLHMIKNPRQKGLEVIIIDGSAWVRGPTGWEKSPAPADSVVPSMAGLFRSGLTHASERPAPHGGRTIDGKLSWSNGAGCEGKVVMQTTAGGRPASLRFEGACDGRPSRFHEAFSYDGPLSIVPPE